MTKFAVGGRVVLQTVSPEKLDTCLTQTAC